MDRHARLHFWLTLGWAALTPVAFLLGWLSSVTFVSLLSLWALVISHWAAYEAARSDYGPIRRIIREEIRKALGDSR